MKVIGLGRISAAVGLKGEVRVKAYDMDREDFLKLPYVCVSGPKHPDTRHQVESMRVVPKTGDWVVKLSGIGDRTQAELLRGAELVINKEDAPALPAGTYYVGDLLGLAVVDETGAGAGVVKNVRTGAQVLYEIEENGSVYLVPGVKAYITEIDLEHGLLRVQNVEQLKTL